MGGDQLLLCEPAQKRALRAAGRVGVRQVDLLLEDQAGLGVHALPPSTGRNQRMSANDPVRSDSSFQTGFSGSPIRSACGSVASIRWYTLVSQPSKRTRPKP